jgi:hypothetical protein
MWFVFSNCITPLELFTFVFLVVEYHNLPPEIEREIFQRVQLGVQLTAAGAVTSYF